MTEVLLQHLSKSYDGRFKAVQDMSLTLPSGRITALLGPSGCGKTTVLKMIAGLLSPDSGDIKFAGQSVLSVPPEKRGAVMVFQNPLLFPKMSVTDNVGFGLRMKGIKRPEVQRQVDAMLELVQLPGYGKRKPQELSGGQQQRIALARALIVKPQLLLLDEPLSSLDAHLRDEMRELILGIQRQLAITMMVVTHDQEEAVILADQIGLIFAGQLQQVGIGQDFYERPLTPQIARFFGGTNFIPGIKNGSILQTALGNIGVNASDCPDGSVTATIRPENVEMRLDGDGIAGEICGQVYAGTYVRYKVDVGGGTAVTPIEVISDPTSLDRFQKNTPVRLNFPPAKIWLMPVKP